MSLESDEDGWASVGMAGRLFVCTSTRAALALVRKSMYAAATSGCGDLAVIAHGRLSPPSETGGDPGVLPGMSMKPALSPIALAMSATTHVPPMKNGPLPRSKPC